MSPAFVWLLAGIALCLAELVLPTTFIVFNLGLAAILVSLVALVLPAANLLIALWVIFALLGVWASRRFLIPKKQRQDLGDAREGKTLTTIPPGKTGRVLYEGNSWPAQCVEESMTISVAESVYIVERQGNTLIVMPSNLLL